MTSDAAFPSAKLAGGDAAVSFQSSHNGQLDTWARLPDQQLDASLPFLLVVTMNCHTFLRADCPFGLKTAAFKFC
jgi:hypothetical protein